VLRPEGDNRSVAVNEETKVRTPLFPLYSAVRAVVPLWVGVRKQAVLQLINDVRAQMGTPQDPVDWSAPDAWISERLQGESETLARKIWEGTERKVNPRHIYGIYLFVNTYRLLQPASDGIYRITPDGERFLQGDSDLEHRIDDAEGLLQLLAILEGKVTAKRSDLLPEWSEFLQEHSNYGTTSTIKDTLRRRLLNLAERGLATRDGNSYA
jgi:restriction system protein